MLFWPKSGSGCCCGSTVLPCCAGSLQCPTTEGDTPHLVIGATDREFAWNAADSTWRCCYTLTHASTYTGNCASPGSGTTAVEFRLTCTGGTYALTQRYIKRLCSGADSYSRDVSCVDNTLTSTAGETVSSVNTSSATATSTGGVQFVFPTFWGPISGLVTITPFPFSELYLTDGFGTVTLKYGGWVPSGTSPTAWSGCALRTVTDGRTPGAPDGSGNCQAASVSFQHAIIYQLTCGQVSFQDAGFRLAIRWRGCTSTGGLNRYPTNVTSYTCSGGWNNGADIYTAKGGTLTLPDSCGPFSLTISETLPTTYPDHAMTKIFGASATWTITS